MTRVFEAAWGESTDGGQKESASKVLFAYALPCEHELLLCQRGRVPSHRLWGFKEFFEAGFNAELCAKPRGILGRFGVLGWRLWQSFWLIQNSRTALGVVAVHEISVIFFLCVRLFGFCPLPLAVVNVGLLHPKNEKGVRRLIWRTLLRKADRVVSLVESQSEILVERFGVQRSATRFVPMLVDGAFYEPVDPVQEEDFCLAVGTNDGKDFETLLEAQPLGVRLVIVTDSYNARKIHAHRCYGRGIEVYENVPALELRQLYRRAAVVVIPLADTPHGSGHTVLLENMALGKIVVVSGSRSMREYVEHGHNGLVVPVGDVATLRKTLASVLENPACFSEMRVRAIADARHRFDAHLFADQLSSYLSELKRTSVGGAVDVSQGNIARKQKEGGDYASVS